MAYNILHDIDETLHQERLAALWKEWRAPLVVGLVLALATLVGVNVWRHHIAEVRASAATLYWQATQAGSEAERNFSELANSEDATYRSLARLQLASFKPADANRYLEAVVDDRAAPAELRDVAALQWGARLIAADPVQAKKVLQDLADGQGPFALLSHEFLGTLAENEGHIEEAKTHYALILQKGVIGTDLLRRARLRQEVLSQ